MGDCLELSEKMIELLKEKARSIEYGRITIELNANMKDVDVVVEERIRMSKEKEPPIAGKVVYIKKKC